MTTFDYAEIDEEPNGSCLVLSCTDPCALESLVQEFSKVYPRCRIKKLEGPDFPAPEDSRLYRIDKLPTTLIGSWWVLKYLCRNGWEPFAVQETRALDDHKKIIYLRRKNHGVM